MAWACKHTDKLHYGKGLCGNCYHLAYYHKRRQAAKLSEDKPETVSKYPYMLTGIVGVV